MAQTVKALHHHGIDAPLLHSDKHGKQIRSPEFGTVLLLHAGVDNEKELSQFLRVLTHHKAVDMVRKCTRQKKSDTEIEDFDLSKSDVNVETIVLDKIDYENMLLLVQSMDEKYKTPLLLKVQGYKVSEIADFLNISPGNVKVRLHRARKIILTGLEENGNE